MTSKPRVGIICGSGMDTLSIINSPERVEVTTSFGSPSGTITLGSIDNVDVVIINRHGVGHRFLPSEINVRANIAALKMLGVEQVLSFSAVGSLDEKHHQERLLQLISILTGHIKGSIHSLGQVLLPMSLW